MQRWSKQRANRHSALRADTGYVARETVAAFPAMAGRNVAGDPAAYRDPGTKTRARDGADKPRLKQERVISPRQRVTAVDHSNPDSSREHRDEHRDVSADEAAEGQHRQDVDGPASQHCSDGSQRPDGQGTPVSAVLARRSDFPAVPGRRVGRNRDRARNGATGQVRGPKRHDGRPRELGTLFRQNGNRCRFTLGLDGAAVRGRAPIVTKKQRCDLTRSSL